MSARSADAMFAADRRLSVAVVGASVVDVVVEDGQAPAPAPTPGSADVVGASVVDVEVDLNSSRPGAASRPAALLASGPARPNSSALSVANVTAPMRMWPWSISSARPSTMQAANSATSSYAFCWPPYSRSTTELELSSTKTMSARGKHWWVVCVVVSVVVGVVVVGVVVVGVVETDVVGLLVAVVDVAVVDVAVVVADDVAEEVPVKVEEKVAEVVWVDVTVVVLVLVPVVVRVVDVGVVVHGTVSAMYCDITHDTCLDRAWESPRASHVRRMWLSGSDATCGITLPSVVFPT